MKNKLIPKAQEGFWARLNKWFANNIKKMNDSAPDHLKEGETSKRPLPMYNSMANIRGNTRIAKHGDKLN